MGERQPEVGTEKPTKSKVVHYVDVGKVCCRCTRSTEVPGPDIDR